MRAAVLGDFGTANRVAADAGTHDADDSAAASSDAAGNSALAAVCHAPGQFPCAPHHPTSFQWQCLSAAASSSAHEKTCVTANGLNVVCQ